MKNRLAIALVLITLQFSVAQVPSYKYHRKIAGITDQWHTIKLPDDIFARVQPSLSDIRIYGVTGEGDTLEVPYFIRKHDRTVKEVDIDFKIINTTSANDGYYFTFEMPEDKAINQLQLGFKEAEYDWSVKLEGSHDQNEWFTIVEGARILSINNGDMQYTYSRIPFPTAKYKYLRLYVPSEIKPILNDAKITEYILEDGDYQHYEGSMHVDHDKKNKRTLITYELSDKRAISALELKITADFDFYRRVKLEWLEKTLKTETGQRDVYQTITTGMISSLEKNEFNFNTIVTNRLRITIDNADNPVLNIQQLEVSGAKYDLVARFDKPADFYLVYGNPSATPPRYDIVNFKNRIPDSLAFVGLGETIENTPCATCGTQPLITNKIWLWVLMLVIMIGLGAFARSMLKK